MRLADGRKGSEITHSRYGSLRGTHNPETWGFRVSLDVASGRMALRASKRETEVEDTLGISGVHHLKPRCR